MKGGRGEDGISQRCKRHWKDMNLRLVVLRKMSFYYLLDILPALYTCSLGWKRKGLTFHVDQNVKMSSSFQDIKQGIHVRAPKEIHQREVSVRRRVGSGVPSADLWSFLCSLIVVDPETASGKWDQEFKVLRGYLPAREWPGLHETLSPKNLKMAQKRWLNSQEHLFLHSQISQHPTLGSSQTPCSSSVKRSDTFLWTPVCIYPHTEINIHKTTKKSLWEKIGMKNVVDCPKTLIKYQRRESTRPGCQNLSNEPRSGSGFCFFLAVISF